LKRCLGAEKATNELKTRENEAKRSELKGKKRAAVSGGRERRGRRFVRSNSDAETGREGGDTMRPGK